MLVGWSPSGTALLNVVMSVHCDKSLPVLLALLMLLGHTTIQTTVRSLKCVRAGDIPVWAALFYG